MQYNKITPSDIKKLAAICGGEHVFTGAAIHEDFSHDEMTIYGVFAPDVVAEALSTEQVSTVMAYAYARNLPVTPRGSGTGLCGGTVR